MVRREMEVQMRDAAAEDVNIDQLGASSLLEPCGCLRYDLAEGRGLLTIQVAQVGNVPARLEVREPGQRLVRPNASS